MSWINNDIISLQEKKVNNLTKSALSRCMYCGSTSFGKGCRYAPHGVHFHPDDAAKCAYCGSNSYGKGCKLNPFGDLHLHGVDYNSMFRESMKNHFVLKELNKKIVEFKAFELGLIDEQGNKIKEPCTNEEKNALSPLTKTFLKIKKHLGSKWDLINQTLALENNCKICYNKENHQTFLKYETHIQDLISQLHETTDRALNDGLSMEQIESFFQ
jgi:hypothetical protein